MAVKELKSFTQLTLGGYVKKKEPKQRQHMQPNKNIQSTMNYDRFIFKRGNRPVGPRVVKLIAAMKKCNRLQEFPILCSSVNGHLEIDDGQHRYAAAKALKLPIFYIVARQPLAIEEIAEVNTISRGWSLNDWLISWVNRGNMEYKKLKDFSGTFQLPITVSMELLWHCYSGNQLEAFRRGEFKCNNGAFAQKVGHVLGALRGHIPVADLRLVRAIVRVMRVPGISVDRLIKKLSAHSSMFERQASWIRYVEMIEKIYNKKVRDSERQPLKFKVEQMERQRRSEKAVRANATRKAAKNGHVE